MSDAILEKQTKTVLNLTPPQKPTYYEITDQNTLEELK